MANSGVTAEAMKHKFGWKSERMTAEYVSGSTAALITNANALTGVQVQSYTAQSAGQQVVVQPPRQEQSVST